MDLYCEGVNFIGKQENITLSFEHQGFAWLPYQEAIKQVTFKNAKEILEKANSFLKNR